MSSARPIVWSVAGSDSGGGAGLQADMKAFDAFGVHGCTVVAALTAQNSVKVRAIEPVSEPLFDAQLAALADDMPPAAIKTGMLGSAANLRVLVNWVDRLRERNPSLRLVVDPVLRATTGAALADETLVDAYRRELLPRATLVTPNRREAAALLGFAPLMTPSDVEHAARALRETGARSVAITGGDDADDTSDDYVLAPWAQGWLRLPRVATANSHGTGCVFASSAAAAMALGFIEIESVVLAKMATTHALRHAYPAGTGAGPVRPRKGFGQEIANLPRMAVEGAALSFPRLADPDLGLYVIVDSAEWVARMLAAGVRTIQLRIKDADHAGLRDEVRASIAAAKRAGAQLFINDHWKIALEEDAYGVHLGQEDLAVADLGAIARAGLRLGVSTHAFWEVCRAWAIEPSYIACGPIHPTRAKAMQWVPQGTDNLAYWCSLLPLPVVAIGGMTPQRARDAVMVGARGVGVIAAVTLAASPEAAVREFDDAIGEAKGRRRGHDKLLPQPTLA